MKGRRQSRRAAAQQPLRSAYIPREPFDFSKPFFNTATAAAFTDSPSPNAFRMWAKRRGIPCGHKGRTVIYRKSDLELAMGFGKLAPLAHARRSQAGQR